MIYDRVALSTAQYNIWLNEQFYSGNAINVIHGALWLEGPAVTILLQEAVTAVMDRNDIFRLAFADSEGEPVQFRTAERSGNCCLGPVCSRSAAREQMDKRSTTPLAFDSNHLYDIRIFPLDDGSAVLSLCLHHILLDGFGMRLLCDQILSAYECLLKNREIPLSPEQFLDNLPPALSPDEEEICRAFWQEYLTDMPEQPLLSMDRASSLDRFTSSKTLSPELSSQIRSFCQNSQLPPYTVFAAALAIYLGRAAQTDDVIIVLPRLGRSETSRSILGIYTLAAPMRIRIPAGASFQQLCRHIHSQGQEISLHKEYGYSRIINDLKTAGRLHNNLSEFTLNYQKGFLTGAIAARLDFSACGAMGNHITMNISEARIAGVPGIFQIDYDCRQDLFDEQRLDFIHGSLAQIMAEALEGRSIFHLTLLTPGEQALVRSLGRGPELPVAPQHTIVSLFRETAARYPDSAALIDGQKRLSFQELDALSDQMAAGLIRRGIGREDLVAFMLPRSVGMAVCMLAILKAGAAFLPLDPQYPPGRIDYMLEDSQASVLISDPVLAMARDRAFISLESLLDTGRVECEASGEEASPWLKKLPVPTPDQLAYCIYTSGTTGRPKGVLIEHRGIVNITRPGSNPFNRDVCQQGRGIVAIGSICFDISMFEIFVPLLNGLFVVIAPEDALADPVAIAGLLAASGANILHCTPTRLSAYLAEDDFQRALGGVDLILAAGEVLPGVLVEELHDKYKVRVYNGYGPTETTIGATITEAGDKQTIGRPIANSLIRITDGDCRDLPLGVAGEILIGGPGTGRGYLNRLELTREKFVIVEGERLYRSGDFGFFQADGRLRYLGRRDTQVKLRGLRIELAEIENCLRQLEGITMAAVIIREIAGQQHLAAFYSSAGAIPAEELKSYLSRQLAPYMVPELFIFMDQLPSTSSGKIDLTALELYPLAIQRPYTAPESPEEHILCQVFSELLQTDPIGASDNFFALGGTSLLAARLMLQARSRGLSLAYGDIFAHPTPRELAAVALTGEQYPDTAISPEQSSGEHGTSPDNTGSIQSLPENPLAVLDYSRLASVLAANRQFISAPPRRLGNVLLTGATGFLGIHILKELIDHPGSVDRIYCLIRPKGSLNGERRLKGSLFYYFEETNPRLCAERLHAVEGDLTLKDLLASPLEAPIDTIINSAANVSHFAYGDALQQVNTTGVRNIISLAQKLGSAVIHVSTLSVGGCATSQQIEEGITLDETRLYVGQRIFNDYIMSKYLAEYHLLQAAALGLPVKIMRVGNIQGRLSDGEFQMNLGSNAFARHLKSFALLKRAPVRLQSAGVNFTPVDDTARAIRLLSDSPDSNTVFHAFNPASAGYSLLFEAMRKFGYKVDWTDDREFDEMVERMARKEEHQAAVEGILLEQPDMRWREVPCINALTDEALKSRGFAWGEITTEYLEKYFYALDSLGFFDS